MPFLVGVPQTTLATVRRSELLEVVLLNADTNQLTTPYDDVGSLPSEVVHSLRKALKSGGGGNSNSNSQHNSALGDGLSRAFLRALVSLIGGYRSALRIVPGEQITFDRDLFLSSGGGGIGGSGGGKGGTSRQLFLERLLQLQIFQQFIETRLDLFNAGQRLDDQFELELNNMEVGSGVNSRFRAQYREWASTMKKEGGAFLRAVNPKVKSAISKSRQAVRTLRSKIGQKDGGRESGGGGSGGSASSNGGSSPASQRQNNTNSTPSSPKLPPKIKKSISGTAISQTSRTVTYVRTPNSTTSTAGKNANHSQKSSTLRTTPNGSFVVGASSNTNSRSSTLSVPSSSSIAPSASSESSDVDEMDVAGSFPATGYFYSASDVPRVDMNITAELESIFRNKATLASSPNGPSSTQRPLMTSTLTTSSISVDAMAPIPPPRANNHNNANGDKFSHFTRHSLKPATLALTNQEGGVPGNRSSAPEKCLIEFDSPPKDGLSPNSSVDNRNSSLGSLVHFDPLLEGSYGQQTSGGAQPTSAAAFFASQASQPQKPANNSHHFYANTNAFANNFTNGGAGNFYGNGQQQLPSIRANGHSLLHRVPPPATTPTSAPPPIFGYQPPAPLPPPTNGNSVNVMALRGRFEPFSSASAVNTKHSPLVNTSAGPKPIVSSGAGGVLNRTGTGNHFQAHSGWQEFD